MDQTNIKVEGHGMGTVLVTDVAVTPVDFEEQFIDDDSEPESDIEEESLWSDEIKAAKAKAEALNKEIEIVDRKINDRDLILQHLKEGIAQPLKAYNFDEDGNCRLSTVLNAFKHEVTVNSEELDYWNAEYKRLQKERDAAVKVEEKLMRKFRRTDEAQEYAWRKVERNQAVAVAYKGVRPVRMKLRITLEKGTLPENTPSVAAEISTGKPSAPEDHVAPAGTTGGYLRISYRVNMGVNWSPRYDLQLDTTTNTGQFTPMLTRYEIRK